MYVYKNQIHVTSIIEKLLLGFDPFCNGLILVYFANLFLLLSYNIDEKKKKKKKSDSANFLI